MKALYTKDAEGDRRDFTDILSKSCKVDFSGTQCRLFTPSGTWMSFLWGDGDEVHSMLFPYPAGTFEAAAVSPQIRFFTNAWGQAFLEQVNRSLATTGFVVLPFYPQKEAQRKGFWSLGWLSGLFGKPQQIWKKVNLARFGRNEHFPHADSILAWYFQQYGQLLVDYDSAAISGLSNATTQQCRDFVLTTNTPETPETPPARGQAFTLEDKLPKQFKAMNYSVSGISYKSALITHCIHNYFGDRKDLKYLDMGGGPGFLTAELLLDNPEIKKGVNVDLRTINLVPARRLSRFYREKLAGRFYMQIQAAQDFGYDDTYDVISFIGILLLVPRDKAEMTLQRAWDALNPGGILIIHENIKSQSNTEYYDVMFTVEELEQLLGRFGHIDYYLSTATVSVNKDQAAQKGVFRVLRKSWLSRITGRRTPL